MKINSVIVCALFQSGKTVVKKKFKCTESIQLHSCFEYCVNVKNIYFDGKDFTSICGVVVKVCKDCYTLQIFDSSYLSSHKISTKHTQIHLTMKASLFIEV